MNLIINAEICVEPRSESLYFRFLTMVARENLGYDVLLEADKEEVDSYYRILKSNGSFDFIDDIIIPEWRLEGARIDTEYNYPYTIKTKFVDCENVLSLTGQLKSLKKILL